ncbi:uncharacterized protein LY89DRAFT_733859 [Mollisia scopiformis]|uniref:Uncharacterized protein n=1 Tax=Mollisia scopiformis TaxID=149040 RepID=A0A194XAR8_MOLSC|nr:uncharacterized protein LY89DRAFT_733859 [Mollisia scopiformis]KUJ16857.1 hypothetical protein LY89DRAFT_733859 [Mollisia scopiformis]
MFNVSRREYEDGICLIAALAKVSYGFTPPAGLPNGVYVYDPADGTHTSIDGTLVSRDLDYLSTGTSFTPRALNSAKFSPRWTGITCGDTVLASLDYASALVQLEGQCDGVTKLPKKNYYSVYGDAMAFICVYKKNTICNVGTATSGGTDMLFALAQLDNKCSATLQSEKSPNHVDGYNRVSNSIVFGFTTSTSSAC